MRTALIGGIGNVLLGDDAAGPYVLRLLESKYEFASDIELLDLGTPALDLTHQIVGLRSLILIDSVTSDDPPGTVRLYKKEDILRVAPAERLDPHSPALSECLLTAEMLGSSPENVLLVGIVGAGFEPGSALSESVRRAVEPAIEAILSEVRRLGYVVRRKPSQEKPDLWWAESSEELPTPS